MNHVRAQAAIARAPPSTPNERRPSWAHLSLSVRQTLMLTLTRMLQQHLSAADGTGEQEVRDESR